MASCVYSRLHTLLSDSHGDGSAKERALRTGLFYLQLAHQRNHQRLRELTRNLDEHLVATADVWLSGVRMEV
jgi:hypothetical protein